MSPRPGRARAPFDSRGRRSAADFRSGILRLLLAVFGLLCLAIWLAGFGLRWPAILAFGGSLLAGLAMLPQAIQRLHDRDRTGWWLGLYLLTESSSVLPLEQAVDAHPVPVLAVLALKVGYVVWFFIETVLRPGTPGPNRYGPAPPRDG